MPSVMNFFTYHKEEECQIHKFWEIKFAGIEKVPQDEMNTYQTTSITFENNRYTARFPWKQNHPEFPSNEAIAKKRTGNVKLHVYQKIKKCSKCTTM